MRWDDLDLVGLLRDAKRLGSSVLSVHANPDTRTTTFYQDATAMANTAGTAGTRTPPPTSPLYGH